MKSNELVEPEISSPNKSFIVSLFYKFIYTKEEKIWLDNFQHLQLSREEKTIIKLGINGRLISPKEIFENVGIVDTDYYRQLVESLRKLGILVSQVSSGEAQRLAKKQNISKKSIARFQIQLPHNVINIAKSSEDNDTSDYAKIFISNVDYNASEQDLETLFLQFGEISDVSIPKDRMTDKSRGFAIVEFEKLESAKKVLENINPIFLGNRKLYVQKYRGM